MKRVMKAISASLLLSVAMCTPAPAEVDMSDPYWEVQEYAQAYCEHRNAWYRDAVKKGIEVDPTDTTLELWIQEDFNSIVSGLGMTIVGEKIELTPILCM
jgi:hypothetical protein